MEVIKTQKGCLSILAGKTDMGKSTISVFNCAEQIRKGENVLFFSYEYCQSIIYNKLITHFELKFQELFNCNIVDSRDWPLKLLIEEIYRKKDTVDVVYIDYLDLLRDATYSRDKNVPDVRRLEEIQIITSELAKVASDLNISIVVLSQVNKEASLEGTVENLNLISSTITTPYPVIKMFIGRDETLNPLIKCNDVSHVILVDGYNLSHFSTVNLKEAYKY